MKTLLLTLATAVLATVFSSCGCCGNKSSAPLEVKHYDHKGRLVKDTHHDGNFTTYHYDGTSPAYQEPRGLKSVAPNPVSTPRNSYAPTAAPSSAYDGSWKPRLP